MKKLIIVLVFLAGCYPEIKTPKQLANYSACNPEMIADWIDAMTVYKHQPKYEVASIVMARHESDCKGRAQIALETLQSCGIDSYIIQLSNPKKEWDHVITVFTLNDGKRGFINSNQWGIYSQDKSWKEIIEDVDDGNWKANFAKEENS